MTTLPALGSPWPGSDSRFAGLALGATGQPYVLLLAAVARGFCAHFDAENLAISEGALLPTRLDGALLRAGIDLLDLDLPKNAFAFWLAERAEPTLGYANAWAQTLTTGCQWPTYLGTERTTVLLVHRLPLQGLDFTLALPSNVEAAS